MREADFLKEMEKNLKLMIELKPLGHEHELEEETLRRKWCFRPISRTERYMAGLPIQNI